MQQRRAERNSVSRTSSQSILFPQRMQTGRAQRELLKQPREVPQTAAQELAAEQAATPAAANASRPESAFELLIRTNLRDSPLVRGFAVLGLGYPPSPGVQSILKIPETDSLEGTNRLSFRAA